ncbi:putative ATP synthase [Cardiosporidium cionae]|uniref:ATP synthase n=1 Tax=Cardiosporidium cionae TaxID=476202 RepID=A0ABQ7JGC9_9APIC|nr:putative ATP synthase [Cardiosporidium cionae]|eukprot:KAF8823048.1 putative ATP synthase [Cardiosporidium cionae]
MLLHLWNSSCRLALFSCLPRAAGQIEKAGKQNIGRRFATNSSSAGSVNELFLTLSSPSECTFKNSSVASVTLPGVEGEFTITPNHAPLVSFLRNGVVTVRSTTSVPDRQFFLSDGFCLLQGPTEDNGSCTAEVLGVEIIPTEFLDKERTAQVLQEMLQNAGSTTDEWEKTKAILGQELCSAIMRAAP